MYHVGVVEGSGVHERDEGEVADARSAAGVFLSGLAVSLSIPGFILFASAGGFGALARDAGLSIGNALLMMGVLFALPAQVVMVDQLARGGALVGAVLAVALIGIRLLPMTVVIVPFLGGSKASWPGKAVAVHAVAITGWIEGLRRLPDTPENLRLPHFFGIGTGLIVAALAGTAAGYIAAGQLSGPLAAALLFLTPIYFMLALLATAAQPSDWLAIVIGAVLGPIAYWLAPGFDLLLTGLIGGSAAHVLARNWRIKRDAGLGGPGPRP